jgi:putative transposase
MIVRYQKNVVKPLPLGGGYKTWSILLFNVFPNNSIQYHCMICLKAYKFLLRPTGEQSWNMNKYAGHCRYIFNRALNTQQENHKASKKYIGKHSMTTQYLVAKWKKDENTKWLSEAPAQSLIHAIWHADKAYKNFFHACKHGGNFGFPKFKKKGDGDGFHCPDSKHIVCEQQNNRIKLPKLGWIKYINSREIKGKIKNATVKRYNNQWFVSVQAEEEINANHPSQEQIGIDVGIINRLTLSNGRMYSHESITKMYEKKLARYQRQMTRKKKGSNNRKKSVLKVRKINAKIRNIRLDVTHKITNEICNQYRDVFVEDINIKDITNPLESKKANKNINKSLNDCALYEVFRQLKYKTQWRGGGLIKVNPAYTSQTCSKCHHQSKENRKNQADFQCIKCRHKEHADVNAAKNILRAGRARFACGGSQDSVKQEPTETRA